MASGTVVIKDGTSLSLSLSLSVMASIFYGNRRQRYNGGEPEPVWNDDSKRSPQGTHTHTHTLYLSSCLLLNIVTHTLKDAGSGAYVSPPSARRSIFCVQ
jgi:hypothetical protein